MGRTRRTTTRTGQLSLDIDTIPSPTGRGGPRPGSGRKRGHRVSHATRERFTRTHPIHVTLRVRDSAAGLRRRRAYAIIRRCIAESHRDTFRVCEMNVLSNHVHLVVEASGAPALSRGIQSLATRMALRMNRRLGRRGKVFADRFHARVMRAPLQVRRCLLYVLQNMKHHGAASWRLPFDPWSSAPSFDGWATPLPRDAAWMRAALAEPRATAPASTWLLTTGWRRHGELRLDESPRTRTREGRAR